MKRSIIFGCIIFMVITLFSQDTVSKKINVKFKSKATTEQINRLTEELPLEIDSEMKPLDMIVFRISGNNPLSRIIHEVQTYDFVAYAEPETVYDTGEMVVVRAVNQESGQDEETGERAQPFYRITSVDTIPGEILVKFKPARSQEQIQEAIRETGARIVETIPQLGIRRCEIVAEKTMQEILTDFRADPNVEYAEPNYVVWALEIPNDPDFGKLWGLNNDGQTGGTFDADIDAPEAWDKQKGQKDIIVSIIDTGIDYNHPDLTANIWINSDEIPNNGVDDDNNGYVDDYRGWDFANNDADPMDDNRHGTHVAGTVGAVGNNATGVVGVNWTVSLMPLKFLRSNGSGSTSDAIKAIVYATDNGAHITSNSWGGGGSSQALKDAIQYASDRGVLFVAAAGNESKDNDENPNYPSNYEVENVIAVASTDDEDRLSSFSNYGVVTVDLAAPGEQIYSTLPQNGYGSLSGTSMATPHTAGAAALVWSHYLPNINKLKVKYRLFGAVGYVRNLQDKVLLNGRLNVNMAITDKPLVAVVKRQMDTNNETGPYTIKASAVDEDTVSSVRLYFRVTGTTSTSDTLDMTGVEAYVYKADIPGAQKNSTVEYKIYATDTDGNRTESRFYSFTVGEADGGGCCGSFAATLNTGNSRTGVLATFLLNFLIFFGPPFLLRWLLKRRR